MILKKLQKIWKRILCLQTTYHCIVVLLDKMMRYSKPSLVCHWHDSFDPFKCEGSKANLKFINKDNFMDRMVARKTIVLCLFIFWWSGLDISTHPHPQAMWPMLHCHIKKIPNTKLKRKRTLFFCKICAGHWFEYARVYVCV